ncbi:DUF58 domain-containing protein [Streptomyces sp. NPDC006544]|uniref:DUF58 domain-containing protein n=1 Tax=Streptomyces sp. NPDC006544 TaxID=3154583 RepID=UPI0033A8C0E4
MSAGAPHGAGGRGPEDGGGLRASLAGLTTRGRSFLAAGVAAAFCAYVLGQSGLLRVGLLLAVLPLICVLALHRTRYRVSGSRRLTPVRVPAGAEARVQLRLDNTSRVPTGLLMLQDRVPYVLGPRPRFVLDRVEPGGRREVSYRVRSDLRGRYPLGPLQLRLTDPFGLVELTRSFAAHDTLTVIPRTEALPVVRLAGESSGYGDGSRRSLALAGEDDVIPRGYRRGDDLRRVHWRSTARYGELMVRREEQPQRSRATVLLDTRGLAYEGAGPDSAFEWAVSGAASALVHLLEQGYAVRLLTDTGDCVPREGGGFTSGGQESAEAAGLMMDTLAVIGHSEGAGLSRAYDAVRGTGAGGGFGGAGGDGLLIAFFGDLDDVQTELAARMCRRSGGAVAFVLDSADWSGQPPALARVMSRDLPSPEERIARLRDAGWTALAAPPGVAFGELWRLAGSAATDTGTGTASGAAGGWG